MVSKYLSFNYKLNFLLNYFSYIIFELVYLG